METIKCINLRRSIRYFSNHPVESEKIEIIAKSANAAPSWKNSQPSRLCAVRDKAVIQKIVDSLGERNAQIVDRAPLLFAVSCVMGKSGYSKDGAPDSLYGDGYTFFDCGLFVQNLCLSAADLGLGTVILGIFDPKKVKEILSVPSEEEVIALVACGYPSEEPKAPPRLSSGKFLRYI